MNRMTIILSDNSHNSSQADIFKRLSINTDCGLRFKLGSDLQKKRGFLSDRFRQGAFSAVHHVQLDIPVHGSVLHIGPATHPLPLRTTHCMNLFK